MMVLEFDSSRSDTIPQTHISSSILSHTIAPQQSHGSQQSHNKKHTSLSNLLLQRHIHQHKIQRWCVWSSTCNPPLCAQQPFILLRSPLLNPYIHVCISIYRAISSHSLHTPGTCPALQTHCAKAQGSSDDQHKNDSNIKKEPNIHISLSCA